MESSDVFISYAHKDQETADAACRRLEADGVRCWIAHRDLVHGTNWPASIIDAINSTKLMVPILSANANESFHVRREVERAADKGLPLLPMRVEDVAPSKELEYFLSIHHRLDAFPEPIEPHLDRLSKSVRAELPSADRHDAPPTQERTDAARSGPRPQSSTPSIVEPSPEKRVASIAAKPEAPALPRRHSSKEGTAVVLLLPELLGGVGAAQLRATLVDDTRSVRALLCLPDDKGGPLAALVAGLGVETEILLGPDVPAPPASGFTLRAPIGTTPEQQIEFALALSDIVVAPPGLEQNPWIHTAVKLEKQRAAPGEALPQLTLFVDDLHALDPDRPGLRRGCGRNLCGRLEQFLTELFTFHWIGRGGARASLRRLGRSFRRRWLPSAYFAPTDWQRLAPDGAVKESSEVLALFDLLDRSALYGSYLHRDLVWLEHIGAAFAVLAAVAGHLSERHHLAWGITEIVTLVSVMSMVIVARATDLQDRWTACRLGAEQLRIALMSMPLLVLPSALATADKPPPTDRHASRETRFGAHALGQVKRVVRDHGLPRLDPTLTASGAADWLRMIVRDQIAYHSNNHRRLEHAESGLRRLTQLIFLGAIVGVAAHLYWPDATHLLLATAAAPAFAAALHGTGTRLGIVHRAALSGDLERELIEVDTALAALQAQPPGTWQEVRRLAFAAAQVMGKENSSWHGLVRRYRDDLP